MDHQVRLAQKYAQAMINVFGASLSRDDVERVQKIVLFLREHRKALFFLRLSRIDQEVKLRALEKLFADFSDKKPYLMLLRLLIQDNRGYLVFQVLREIVGLYRQMHHIMPFTIASSNVISRPELDKIEQFLARQTGGDIIYTYRHEPSLIAGLRLQSETLLWEHSIRKQLRELALRMAPEG